MKKSSLIVLLLIAVSSGRILGHGIEVKSRMQHPAVITTSAYSANQFSADAQVTIFSPADQEKPYQTGRTDKTGNFTFIPDIAGDWGFIVDDQKGHAEKTTITIDPAFFTPSENIAEEPVIIAEPHDHEIPVTYKALTGLSLIFGMTGIFYGIKSKQSARK